MPRPLSILIPTYNRNKALAVTLTSLYYQTEADFDIIISDQSPQDKITQDNSVQTAIRLLQLKGHAVTVLRNIPPRGMAQQRQFLLDHSPSPYSLFLDDDLVFEPYVVHNLKQCIEHYGCGFAGCAVIGLSFLNDYRPHEQQIEFWEGKVEPEEVIPGAPAWNRYVLHNAANIYHVQKKTGADPAKPRVYKVAWVGGCVLYDTRKLIDCGGFSFWKQLPEQHCGEDVLAQLRVMKRYGGCGILPSGVYHQQLDTTIPDRSMNAPELLPI